MKKKRKYILGTFIFLIAIILFIVWKLFGPTISAPQEKFFYIRTGSTYQNVKDSLIKKKIISSEMMFDKVAK